jgi:hypothetical protein
MDSTKINLAIANHEALGYLELAAAKIRAAHIATNGGYEDLVNAVNAAIQNTMKENRGLRSTMSDAELDRVSAINAECDKLTTSL